MNVEVILKENSSKQDKKILRLKIMQGARKTWDSNLCRDY